MNAEEVKRQIETDKVAAITATLLKMAHAKNTREFQLLLDGITIMFFVDCEDWLN
ncbi:MAG: hypothetical protein ABR953_11610 [Candidatus Acidiferrales bacterium]|jgi:hypothetical protein